VAENADAVVARRRAGAQDDDRHKRNQVAADHPVAPFGAASWSGERTTARRADSAASVRDFAGAGKGNRVYFRARRAGRFHGRSIIHPMSPTTAPAARPRPSVKVHRIEVAPAPGRDDVRGEAVRRDAAAIGVAARSVRSSKVYLVEGALSDEQLERLAHR